MVAEYERAKILERSRRGKRHAAHEGRISVLSGAPYGYRYIGKHEGGGVARYTIDEAEAPAVRLMFQWTGHDRISIGEVCRRLRQHGFLTRSGKPAWDRTTVWGILKNPAYVGAAAFGKTRIGGMRERLRPVRGGAGKPRWPPSTYDVPEQEWLRMPVPALIESDLFAVAQEQLAENRQRNRQTRRGQRYLLQGLLVCRRCGYAYYGKAISLRAAKGKQRDYAYYRCCGSDAHRFGGQRLCANPQLRTDRADATVWQEVQRLLQNPDMIAAEYERRLHRAQHPDANRPDLITAEAQIAKLRRGIARLIDGYTEGLIEKAEFEQRITGLRQRIKTWEQQAATLQDEAALRRTLSLIIGRLEDFAKQVRQRMDAPDWSLQRDLIRLLVKRVEVDHDEINVVFRVAPPPASLPPGPEGGRSWQDCWRSDHRALSRPRFLDRHNPVFEDAGPQPFLDEPDDALVADPVLQEADDPFLGDLREERPDVGVENEIHLPTADPDNQRVQRIMLAAPWPEPVREPEEILLVDRAQHRCRGSLGDLVFQRHDRERALAAVFLRNVAPTGWLRPVCSASDPCMQVLNPAIEVLFVGLPCHPVYTGGGVALERVERRSQHGRVDMVQERGEPLLLPLPRGLPYAFQRL